MLATSTKIKNGVKSGKQGSDDLNPETCSVEVKGDHFLSNFRMAVIDKSLKCETSGPEYLPNNIIKGEQTSGLDVFLGVKECCRDRL